ncbi:MAG: hypothetical protein RJA81_1397 [Planctomycetota bacterium]|jgi:predicted RNA-binding protein with PIN domain
MRLLIDGYNLLHAQGLTGNYRDPDRLSRAREKLLRTISKRLAPVDRHATRVIFDASTRKLGLPTMIWVDGITVEFAVDHPTADARLCLLIAQHELPEKLVVVSSDNEIIVAARRRGCAIVGSEKFMEILEDSQKPVLETVLSPAPNLKSDDRKSAEAASARSSKFEGMVPHETDFWLQEFEDLVKDETIAQQLNSDHTILKSIDISKIEKEISDLDPFDIRHKKK